ncbi:MAG TPA: hypothetical protein GX523_03220 [Desulfitobacterium dehalogenans]|uniref:MORN repeat protein n=1 Tax=Desulfitobacterium dehalogenans TaxID=36854 RepID=A0A7C7D8B6_9FIRM|nr:hypothetical protein [Desulfitobacterium dehalogenans]
MGKKGIFALLVAVVLVVLTGCSQNVSGKKITITYGDETVSGTYTGLLESGKASGEGVFAATDNDKSWTYSGSFEKSKMVNKGTLTDFPMSVTFQEKVYNGLYTGECVEGVASGKGVFTAADGEEKFIYDGNFDAGAMAGSGKLETTTLTLNLIDVERTGAYSGEIVNFVPEGRGEFKTTNSEGKAYTISGEWKNGLQHGQSTRAFEDSSLLGEKGTFVNGVYKPTTIEFLSNIGEMESMPFKISQVTFDFYNEHSSLFPAKSTTDFQEYLNREIEYKHLDKNITNYYKQIVELKQFRVIQVFEMNSFYTGGADITEILATNGSDIFYIYYPGKYDVYAGDTITLYGLPIAMSSFKNVGGGTTLPCILLGSYVES